MSHKHTSAPWEISQEPPRWIIQAECGPGKRAIAYLVGDYVKCAADARLIAAAPDMLVALKEIEARGHTEMQAIARAAIAKATTP